jgi:hypothetical protein
MCAQSRAETLTARRIDAQIAMTADLEEEERRAANPALP